MAAELNPGEFMIGTVATIAGVVILIGVVVPIMRPRGIDGLMRDAKRTGDLSPLAAMLAAAPEKTQADKIDQTCIKLWNSYEREATARLLVEIAPQSDAPIVQYWIKQVLEIEPEIAAQVFTVGFMEEQFRPDVASKCGRCGCG